MRMLFQVMLPKLKIVYFSSNQIKLKDIAINDDTHQYFWEHSLIIIKLDKYTQNAKNKVSIAQDILAIKR